MTQPVSKSLKQKLMESLKNSMAQGDMIQGVVYPGTKREAAKNEAATGFEAASESGRNDWEREATGEVYKEPAISSESPNLGPEKSTLDATGISATIARSLPDGITGHTSSESSAPTKPEQTPQPETSTAPAEVSSTRTVDTPPAPEFNSHQKKYGSISGGSMADLTGFKDLSKSPLTLGPDLDDAPALGGAPTMMAERPANTTFDRFNDKLNANYPAPSMNDLDAQEVDTEFSGNVKTLIRLVGDLPADVSKQTGAQIIRLTMEAMGISMEDVLSEAQAAQSEMLDAVRANIKKIEEYKTVIRKLESDIKYFQGRANELSEIIDLFILSNTSGQQSVQD